MMTLNLKSSLFSIEWGTTRSAPLLRERDKTVSRSLSGRRLNHPPSQRNNTHTHTRRVIVQPLLSKVKSFHRRQCEKSEREEDDVSPLCVGLDQTTTHKTTTGQVRFPIQMGWTSWYLRFTSHSAHCTPAAASSIRRVFAPHLVNE